MHYQPCLLHLRLPLPDQEREVPLLPALLLVLLPTLSA